jgi:hypothetical protein
MKKISCARNRQNDDLGKEASYGFTIKFKFMNRLIFGVLAAGTALGASALKNVEPHTTPVQGEALPQGYFVQTAANVYNYVSTLTAKDGQCDAEAVRLCKYTVPAENSIPSAGPYTEAQIQSLGLSPATDSHKFWMQEP